MNDKFTYLRKRTKCRQGFTLIETLIAMTLVVILGLVCAGMVAFFAKYTRQDAIRMCLLQAASSGIEHKRANLDATSVTVSCGGYTANVQITSDGTLPTTPPAMGSGVSACVKITSTATIKGKSMELNDLICNFPEEDD